MIRAAPVEPDVEDGTIVEHGVLAGSYLTQGTVYGFASFILVPTLAAEGVSLEAQTGILALAGLPWIFKLGWAPVLDRLVARGRGPKVVLSLAMALVGICVCTIATLEQPAASVTAIAVLWLLLNVALSLQDVATDALALDIIAPRRRGVANGVMLGSHHVGMDLLGGWALGFAVAGWGWSTSLWVVGALTIATAVGLMLARTRTTPSSEQIGSRPRLRWSDVRELLGRPGAWITAAVASTVLFADVGTSAIASEFIVNRLDWTLDKVAAVLPPVVGASNLIAYGLAAAVVDRIGHGRAAVAGSTGMALVWIGFGLAEPLWHRHETLIAMIVVQAIVTAWLYVGIHAALMDRTDLRLRATHFALLMAALNLPRVIAPGAAAATVQSWGWAAAFVAAGLYQLAVAGVLHRWSAGREASVTDSSTSD